MADTNYVKAPRAEGESISVFFQSTKCDMETKTSGAGKSYKNFLYEVIVAGEEQVSILPIYEKNQQFIDQLSKFKPTKDDLCIIKAKTVRSKNGGEFVVLALEIPSKGLGGESSGSGEYQGETREERNLRNIVIGASWATELVYVAHQEWFTALDHQDSDEETRTLAEGNILKEIEKLQAIRDKVVKSRLQKLVTQKQHATNQGSGSDNSGQS